MVSGEKTSQETYAPKLLISKPECVTSGIWQDGYQATWRFDDRFLLLADPKRVEDRDHAGGVRAGVSARAN